MLYACGSNGEGQLGLNHKEDSFEWQKIDYLDISIDADVIGGGNHTLIVDQGKAFCTENAKFVPVSHPLNREWKLGGATFTSMVLIDFDNQIYISTINDIQTSSYPTPQFVKFHWQTNNEIIQVKCGMSHTAILTNAGDLYTWGASRKGQCFTKEAEISTPVKCPYKLNPSCLNQFVCGRDYTAILRPELDQLQIFGNNRHFKSEVINCPKTTEILSSWTSILLLPINLIIGNNWQNLLEIPEHEYDGIALGSEHGLLIRNNTVITWGWKEHGNCPPPCKFKGQIKVFGGCATSFVLTSETS